MHVTALENIEQHVPVRIGERNQTAQSLALAVVKVDFLLLARKPQGIVQEHLVYLDDVAGQLIDKLAAVFGVSANHPQHKLMLGHRRDVAVHPGGHTAVHVGVAALEH